MVRTAYPTWIPYFHGNPSLKRVRGLLALSNVVRRIRNNAKRIDDLRITPNNRLEPLQGGP